VRPATSAPHRERLHTALNATTARAPLHIAPEPVLAAPPTRFGATRRPNTSYVSKHPGTALDPCDAEYARCPEGIGHQDKQRRAQAEKARISRKRVAESRVLDAYRHDEALQTAKRDRRVSGVRRQQEAYLKALSERD
jgi:hypothetical protein